MKNSQTRLTLGTIGVAALALTMTAATPASARGGRALEVRAVSVDGHTITVRVVNVANRAARGTVVARVLTRKGIVAVRAVVNASAGDASTVRMDLPDTTVVDAPPLGVVVDDGVPF